LITVAAGAWWVAEKHGARTEDSSSAIVHTERAGALEISLRAPAGVLHTGANVFTLEFRRASDQELVNVGAVHATGNMSMPGMVMPSGLEVTTSGVAGRYNATAEFGMAGSWQLAIEWDGPAGKGAVNFQGAVQ
jgi:hypothetical protein